MLVAMEDRTDGPRGGTGTTPREPNAARDVRVTDAAITDLAEDMWIPEGLLRAVIEHYPELNRVLARRYSGSTCTA
jgi:hypothetical protein